MTSLRPSIVALAVALAACSSPTELMLVVKAGPGLTIGPNGQIDEVRVRAQPASDPPTTFFFDRYVNLCTTAGSAVDDMTCRPHNALVSADYDGALTLPIHLLLEPGDHGLNEDLRVWVDGLSQGKVVLASGLRFRFSQGHRLWLELPLFTQCLGKLSCQEEDLACGYDTDCVAYLTTPTDTGDDGGGSSTGDLAGADLTLGDFATSHDLTMSEHPDLTGVPDDLAGPSDMHTEGGMSLDMFRPGDLGTCGAGMVCSGGVCVSAAMSSARTSWLLGGETGPQPEMLGQLCSQ